ncbi:hypothetical protein SRABI84_01483 [Peribacillus simplex]|nr:hypothetical protein SRABI84_01483 [Peribacillus simplex]
MMKAKRGGIMLPLFFCHIHGGIFCGNRGNIESLWCNAFSETAFNTDDPIHINFLENYI